MTKTAKRGRPAAVRPVGRPEGKAKKTSDAQRIRNILERFGVTLETAKVKAKLAQANNFLKGNAKVKFNKALDVKIAQVRSKLRVEATGVKRQSRGRLTKAEKAMVEARLNGAEAPAQPVTLEQIKEAVEVVKAEEAAAVEAPAVEAPANAPEAVVDAGLAEVAQATEAA